MDERDHALARRVGEEREEDDSDEQGDAVERRDGVELEDSAEDEIQDDEERERLDDRPDVSEHGAGVLELELRQHDDLQHPQVVREPARARVSCMEAGCLEPRSVRLDEPALAGLRRRTRAAGAFIPRRLASADGSAR